MFPQKNNVAGSTPFDNSTNGFAATDVQAAIEEAKATAVSKVRFTLVTTFNGVVGNNSWLGYSELLPGNTSPIRLPLACILREISFSWNGTSVDGTYRIYKNGTAAGDIVYTTTFTNQNGGSQITGVNISFAANNFYSGFWVDAGDNPLDMSIVYYFEVT